MLPAFWAYAATLAPSARAARMSSDLRMDSPLSLRSIAASIRLPSGMWRRCDRVRLSLSGGPDSALNSIAGTVGQQAGMLGGQLGLFAGIVQHVIQAGNRDDRDTVLRGHLLRRGLFALATLLPVQRDQHAGRFGTVGADQGQRFAHGSAGGHHVVDDQHAPD